MVAGAEGQSRRSTRLFGAARRQTINAPLAPYERAHHDRRVATTRQQMDATSFEATWQEGEAMGMAQAVDYALSGGD